MLLLFGTQMALAYYIMHGFRNGKETFCPEWGKKGGKEKNRAKNKINFFPSIFLIKSLGSMGAKVRIQPFGRREPILR